MTLGGIRRALAVAVVVATACAGLVTFTTPANAVTPVNCGAAVDGERGLTFGSSLPKVATIHGWGTVVCNPAPAGTNNFVEFTIVNATTLANACASQAPPPPAQYPMAQGNGGGSIEAQCAWPAQYRIKMALTAQWTKLPPTPYPAGCVFAAPSGLACAWYSKIV